MSMNHESRKRAIATMLGTDDFIEGSLAHVQASEHLDRLLAAGFHVAEWRKVEDAESLTKYLTTNGDRVDTGKYSQVLNRWCHVGHSDKPTAIMDLPEPPKTEGEA